MMYVRRLGWKTDITYRMKAFSVSCVGNYGGMTNELV